MLTLHHEKVIFCRKTNNCSLNDNLEYSYPISIFNMYIGSDSKVSHAVSTVEFSGSNPDGLLIPPD